MSIETDHCVVCWLLRELDFAHDEWKHGWPDGLRFGIRLALGPHHRLTFRPYDHDEHTAVTFSELAAAEQAAQWIADCRRSLVARAPTCDDGP